MARTFEEIRQLALDLQQRRTPLLQYMQEIKRHYEADWVVPLPETPKEQDMAQFTPSLITDAIDGLGLRAASITPVTHIPPKGISQAANNRAMRRRKALAATYHNEHWKVKRRRYYRHLCAYDTASIFVDPDFENETVRLNVRDPLFTYPEPMSAELVRPPRYVAFINRFSGSELRGRFPAVREEQGGPIADVDQHQEWDMVEWVDEEQIVYGLLGPTVYEGKHIAVRYREGVDSNGPWMQLGPALPNRAGVCLAVTPQEVSLHSVGTRLNALLGNVEMQARLMALEVLAQQKAIFPDMFVISNPNETPLITSAGGEWRDGVTGDMNMLRGVAQVGQITQTPDMRTQAMIDRLERNTNVSAGSTPQMRGESYGSLRTGRALDSMMSSSIDPRIQELHEVTEAWMPHVNKAIFATYEGWFGPKMFSMYSGWSGDKGHVEFTPEKDFDSYENSVEYAIPGADVIQQTQVLGSMLGAKVISTETFQTLHPYIEDGQAERANILQEDLFKAMVAGVQEQIAGGTMPIAIVARLYELVREGKSLPEALTEIDEEIRQQQAEAQAAAAQTQPDPLAQMGLAAGPGAAAPTAVPPGAGPPPLAPGGPGPNMEAMLQAALAGGA